MKCTWCKSKAVARIKVQGLETNVCKKHYFNPQAKLNIPVVSETQDLVSAMIQCERRD